jgi:hypothetical protein
VPEDGKAARCTTANRVLEKAHVRLHQPNTSNVEEFFVGYVLAAGSQVASHLASKKPSCTNNAIEFAYSQSAAIGLFAGAEVHQHGVTSDVLDKLLEYARDNAVSQRRLRSSSAQPMGVAPTTASALSPPVQITSPLSRGRSRPGPREAVFLSPRQVRTG